MYLIKYYNDEPKKIKSVRWLDSFGQYVLPFNLNLKYLRKHLKTCFTTINSIHPSLIFNIFRWLLMIIIA